MIASIVIAILCKPVGKATTVVESTLRVNTTTLSIYKYVYASPFFFPRNQSSSYSTTVGSTGSVLNINSTTLLIKKRNKTQRKRMNSVYDVSIDMYLIIMLPKNYKLYKYIKVFVWIAVRQL